MTKKDFECQVHTWMMEKAKSRVYKGDREREGGGGSERNDCYTLLSYLELFYTKLQYFGPRSD